MSSVRSSSYRRVVSDHFEPQDESDPAAHRRLRGLLEQIDYTAFASNREVVAQMLGPVDVAKFQRLALAAAHARAAWVAEGLALAGRSHLMSPEQTGRMAQLRATYEELTEVYEAMRRMVERGYLHCSPNGAA
ncbi:hypothetical protein [Phenylobacterium sp.]|jgi:hypothetical protein|uniref:hypothetical protein n=1 Tax=Phenylobacterium sp. TaxID=1871053 RepID=UPI000C8D7B54|nr:hypothetical protein [Phenylobacterium sp.]MAK81692.1 hypothetical protein [Phenylobacterium sp.]|tara:strand:- start:71406 stop:71804 length:399 start_codon:yes stop_codon:yes gene_type:complete